METSPRYSFIIPVYNTEAYIRTCVSSLQAQTFENFEILLVDDGSSDGSLQICRDLARTDGRIKVLQQENQGPGMARNRGMEAARGDYLLFCDSDDWYGSKDALQHIHDRIGADPDVDMVVFNAVYTRDGGVSAEPVSMLQFLQKSPAEYCTGKEYLWKALQETGDYLWFSWLYAFRREKMVQSGIRFPGKKLSEDKEVVYKYILAMKKVVVLNEYIYVHRNDRPDSCTYSMDTFEKLSAGLEATQICIREAKARKDLPDEMKKLLCSNFAVEYFVVLMRADRLKGKERRMLLDALKREKHIMADACAPQLVLVRRIADLLGVRAASRLLGLRRDLRENPPLRAKQKKQN